MSTYTIGEIAVWLVLAAGLGFVLGWLTRELVARTRSSSVATPAAAPTPAAAAPEPARADPVTPGPHRGSALPRPDGSAPTPEHTIKVSGSSKIYHGPASPAWGRTKAAFWFTSAEAAEAAGFRKPKNG